MLQSNNSRFTSMVAAIACAIITIGFSVAPAVSPVAGIIA
jgi:hypothetical protein